MPKKSFPITPESNSYSNPYQSYPRSWRERAVEFVDDVMDPVTIGAGVGMIAGLGAAYALSPELREAVTNFPEYAAEIMTKDIENGNVPGIGFGDNFNRMTNGQTLDQSEVFEGAMFGSYSPTAPNTFPIEIIPGETYTVPGYGVQTVPTPGK